ncbi:guanylate-binding protein 3-like [Dendrobates tinctorius]|uniref:guanylate-binding protein 3-like n=1 Tax=Dendrobates tinctorius TaxID=92724 RepID=UPI003CCA6236
MNHPVCLIENHEDGTIQVNQNALKILSGITQKVVVVAIVGKYRTGKSYLMNRLSGSKNGFSLGSTVQSMTKGIWMWCVPHPLNREQTLVLIDTEGLGDIEKGNSQNDSWIFALAVLLSSTLVFNSVGTIDQQAMDQLHYVTELTEKIKIKSSELEADLEDDSSEFKRTFPSFVWCVRDFSLELKFDGKDITEDEYLKTALRLKKGLSTAVQNYNLPRECLLHYFHSHKCFVFDRPASKTVLQNLDNIEETQLNASFVEQSIKFCDYIYRNSQVKSLSGGYKITGRGLGDLAVSYVEAIRSGSIPSLENAVLALTKLENSRAIVEALSKYEEMMSQNTSKFPTETCEDFLNLDKACQSEALNVFMKLSFKDENQEYQGKLVEELESKKAAYFSQNEEASVRKCKALLEELSARMKKAINDGKFSVAGGYKLFTEEKKTLEDNYMKATGKGMKYLEVLQEFLKEMEPTESTILQADKTLEEKEKKLAEQRKQAEDVAREKKILEKNNMELQKKQENDKETYKMHLEMLEKKMNEERENMRKENEWMIQEKLKEQKALLDEGFKRRAEMMEEDIRRLKEETKKPPSTFLGDLITGILPGAVGNVLRKTGFFQYI